MASDTAASGGTDGGAGGGSPEREMPRTETTVTTRISIKIPGSRPIPPVVLRTSLGSAEDEDGTEGAPAAPEATGASATADPHGRPAGPAASQDAPAPQDGTGNPWFAPHSLAAAPAAQVPGGPVPGGPLRGAQVPGPESAPGGPDARPHPEPAGPLAATLTEPVPVPGPRAAEGAFPPPADPTAGPPAGEPLQHAAGRPHGGPVGEPFAQPHHAPHPGPAAEPFGHAAEDPPTRQLRRVDPPPAGHRLGAGDQPPFPPAPGAGPEATGGGESAVRVTGPLFADEPGPDGLGDPGQPSPAGGLPGPREPEPYHSGPDPYGADALGPDAFGHDPAGPGPLRPDPAEPVPAATAAGEDSTTGYRSSRRRQRSARRRGAWAIAAAVVVGVAGALYGVGLLIDGADVPRNTTVLGTDIGGRDRAAAAEALEEGLRERATAAIPVRVGEEELSFDPMAGGLSVDVEATLDRAAARSYAPQDVIGSLFGAGREVAPVVRADDSALNAEVAALAAETDVPLREGRVVFTDGVTTPQPGETGRMLDQPAAAELIRDAYLTGAADRPVVLPLEVVEPKVTEEEMLRATSSFGTTAMSGLVTLEAGGITIDFSPRTLGTFLTMEADDEGILRPTIDTEKLAETYGGVFDSIGDPPKPASFEAHEDGSVSVVPSEPGRGVTGEAAAAAMLPALTRTDDRVGHIELGEKQPDFTTEDAEALGIREVISSATTEYPYAEYRLTNIHRAADLIDGSIVMPGEVWSLNETVGERTAENGFVKGTIINGGRLAEDYGGGVSQVATTMWTAVFYGGLKDVQHKAHSFWLPRYEPGLEATVAWPSLDNQWENDSGHPVYVQASYTDSTVTITLLGTRKYDEIRAESSPRTNIVEPERRYDESEECVPQEPSEGFDITVTRVFVQDGREVAREPFFTSYDPADHIICGPDPAKQEEEQETAEGEEEGSQSPAPEQSPAGDPADESGESGAAAGDPAGEPADQAAPPAREATG
ncbi:VanW family protein [Allostreptomyces psammosilenae]|uniref:Vancomycin resistance protein YoaR n=1 Tax=Allostreptomyces psammosilenae TaxID=1892865 RepID=A0A853A3N1_9ACTN|nr:VanW family protein [Allostreptomyces psammosilenae]NYI08080.1 vancomycin resistance protein YoaR [Allostreptomyces psammosilenae]